MTRPGFEPGRRGEKPATNRLSYGAALMARYFGKWEFWIMLILLPIINVTNKFLVFARNMTLYLTVLMKSAKYSKLSLQFSALITSHLEVCMQKIMSFPWDHKLNIRQFRNIVSMLMVWVPYCTLPAPFYIYLTIFSSVFQHLTSISNGLALSGLASPTGGGKRPLLFKSDLMVLSLALSYLFKNLKMICSPKYLVVFYTVSYFINQI
jgi:hypothetical protein